MSVETYDNCFPVKVMKAFEKTEIDNLIIRQNHNITGLEAAHKAQQVSSPSTYQTTSDAVNHFIEAIKQTQDELQNCKDIYK